jgi:hypothetical protein
VSRLLGRTKGIIQVRNGYPGLGDEGKTIEMQTSASRGRLLTPVQLDRKRSKGDKAVVAEAGMAYAVVAAVESKE